LTTFSYKNKIVALFSLVVTSKSPVAEKDTFFTLYKGLSERTVYVYVLVCV